MSNKDQIKRKREDMAGVMDLVRGVTESVSKEDTAATSLADGCFPVREIVRWKRDRRTSMSNSHAQVIHILLNDELIGIENV